MDDDIRDEVEVPIGIKQRQRQPDISIKSCEYHLIEIVTRHATIRIQLDRGKVGHIEQTEIIKV